MSVHENVIKRMQDIPSETLEEGNKALEKLADMGRNMTGKERLEQKRYTLYGSPNPDSETKERIDKYMKDYYDC